MNDIEKLRTFLSGYPGMERLRAFYIDYTAPTPETGGLRPQGLTEVSRRADILGGVTVEDRYTFGLYYVLEKAPGDEAGAAANAAFLLDLQAWVREQSALGLAPAFGDIPGREVITAGDGVLYAGSEEGVATYRAKLTVTFYKYYRR